MRVLVLGAGGFIGSHLTSRLLSEGHDVVAVDLYDDKIAELAAHERLTFLQQDIRDRNWDMEGLVGDSDVVVDLIAYANPGLCVRAGKRLVQFSTCEVYGRTAASIATAAVHDPEDPLHATFNEDSPS